MKRNRDSSGRFRKSYTERLLPLVFLILSMLLCYFIQEYYKEEELLSPYVDSFVVRAVEPEILPEEIPEPTSTPNPWKTAKVTAYSCNGITDEYHLKMNCPSLIAYGEPRTSNGTKPIEYKTMACDPANMGRTFELEGIGLVKCTDTGGAIKGAGRFDLYVTDIQTAYEWGKQDIRYKLVETE